MFVCVGGDSPFRIRNMVILEYKLHKETTLSLSKEKRSTDSGKTILQNVAIYPTPMCLNTKTP